MHVIIFMNIIFQKWCLRPALIFQALLPASSRTFSLQRTVFTLILSITLVYVVEENDDFVESAVSGTDQAPVLHMVGKLRYSLRITLN